MFIDPGAPLAPLAFYASLFVALTGTLSRLLVGAPSPEDKQVGHPVANLGHAAAASALVLFALWLQSLGMLTSFNGSLLAATLILIEVGFFFSGGRRRPKATRRPRRSATREAGSSSER